MTSVIRSVVRKSTLRISLLTFGLIMLTGGGATLLPQQVSAETVDSAVVLNVYADGKPSSAAVALYSGQHSFGNCNSASGQSFTVSGGTRTCTGYQFGPPTEGNQASGVYLYISGVQSGYSFSNFRASGSTDTGNYGCDRYCYFNFSSGSVTVNVNLTKNPPPAPAAPQPATPAAPTSPSLSVTGNGTTTVSLGWTQPQINGGLNRYELYANGNLIATTTSRSFTHSGLACGQSRSYRVQVVDNYGQAANSNTVTGDTLACPVATLANSNSTNGTNTTSTATTATATGTVKAASTGTSSTASANKDDTDASGKLADTGPGDLLIPLFTATTIGVGVAHYVFTSLRRKLIGV